MPQSCIDTGRECCEIKASALPIAGYAAATSAADDDDGAVDTDDADDDEEEVEDVEDVEEEVVVVHILYFILPRRMQYFPLHSQQRSEKCANI